MVCDMCKAPCSPRVWINLFELGGLGQAEGTAMAYLPPCDVANTHFLRSMAIGLHVRSVV